MAIYFGTNRVGQLTIGTTDGSSTPITLQQKSVNPTESQQIITPDSGYTGLSRVTVGAINSNYIGSNIARRTGTDITVSGNAVTVPIGYFAAAATASVATATHANPTATINTSTGLVTASHTQAAGYVAAGTTTGTLQLTVQAAKTVTPTTSEQTAVAANRYTTGAIKVSAIQTETKSITANGTYTPSSGKYFSSVTVNVSGGGGVTINNQDKTVTPSTSQQSITADSGYTGLGTVTVNAMPTMTLPTAAAGSASGTSKATITPTTAAQYINIPTGYNGTASYYKINAIPSTYIVPSGNKAITANGTNIDVTQYATVSVNIPSSGTTINNQNKTVTPTTSSQSVTADSGYTGLGIVTVNAIPSSYIIPSGNKNITANGTNIDVKNYSTVSVAVPATTPNLQAKTGINPTTSSQTITADSGYDGLQSVQINAMPTMSLPTTLATSAASGYTRVATVDRNTATRYINIPAGYHSGNEYYQISAVANGSVTAPSSISGTTATVSTGTNSLTLTKTISVTPNVTTAGYISSGTAGNASVSLTASVTTKAAATYRASTSAQTIAAGTYLTGAQTIAAVSQTNLSAANIKAGTTISVSNGQSNIWSVAGTFTSDATATAADINSGETAYVNGVKITGTQTFATIYMVEGSRVADSVGNDGDICIVRNMLL